MRNNALWSRGFTPRPAGGSSQDGLNSVASIRPGKVVGRSADTFFHHGSRRMEEAMLYRVIALFGAILGAGWTLHWALARGLHLMGY